ncbi:MAG TPA: cyclic nucleotide-binding domain-containing protein, partial [Bryobacteraceae bacterium]|nr:cyclic nucleotide-binding domain-containing protein [Bryobacteraceae bacterium]
MALQAKIAKRARVHKEALEEVPRRAPNDYMTPKLKAVFDPKLFLSKVGKGRTISEYRKSEVVFAQGDRADAIFYIQKGKVKLTVVSNAGKEA